MFTANPEVLAKKGNDVVNSSVEFKTNVDKVYQTVDDLIKNGYLSPAALSIAKEIEGHRNTLEEMAKVIEEYGNFFINSSNEIIRNENDIMSEVEG